MIRTITFLGLLLAAVISLNAEIPVAMDPDGPPNDGGGRRKTPPMSLTAYIDVVPMGFLEDASGPYIVVGENRSSSAFRWFNYNWGWGGQHNGFYFDPDEWPENHAYIKKRGCITDLHKK